jgi:hypothetical protein
MIISGKINTKTRFNHEQLFVISVTPSHNQALYLALGLIYHNKLKLAYKSHYGNLTFAPIGMC